jgi:hypothetical protein
MIEFGLEFRTVTAPIPPDVETGDTRHPAITSIAAQARTDRMIFLIAQLPYHSPARSVNAPPFLF